MKNIKNWLTKNNFNYEVQKWNVGNDMVTDTIMVNNNYEGMHPTKEVIDNVNKVRKYIDRFQKDFKVEAVGHYTGILIQPKTIDDALIQAAVKENKINDLSILENQLEKIQQLDKGLNSRDYINFVKNDLGIKSISDLKTDYKDLYKAIQIHMLKYAEPTTWIKTAKGMGYTEGTREEILQQLNISLEVAADAEQENNITELKESHNQFIYSIDNVKYYIVFSKCGSLTISEYKGETKIDKYNVKLHLENKQTFKYNNDEYESIIDNKDYRYNFITNFINNIKLNNEVENMNIKDLSKKYMQERYKLNKSEFISLFENFVSIIDDNKKELINNDSQFYFGGTTQEDMKNMNNLLCKNILILGFDFTSEENEQIKILDIKIKQNCINSCFRAIKEVNHIKAYNYYNDNIEYFNNNFDFKLTIEDFKKGMSKYNSDCTDQQKKEIFFNTIKNMDIEIFKNIYENNKNNNMKFNTFNLYNDKFNNSLDLKNISLSDTRLLNQFILAAENKNKLEMNLQALATTQENKQSTEIDPLIEKWNIRLNTKEKLQKQLDAIKRIIIKRKSDVNSFNFVPCNGFIISKLLQVQGVNIQFDRYNYKKCYYVIKESTPESIVITLKDNNDELHYYTIKTTLEPKINDMEMNLQLLASEPQKIQIVKQHNNFITTVDGYSIKDDDLNIGYTIEDDQYILQMLDNGIKWQETFNSKDELFKFIKNNKTMLIEATKKDDYNEYIQKMQNKVSYDVLIKMKDHFRNVIGQPIEIYLNPLLLSYDMYSLDLDKLLYDLNYNNQNVSGEDDNLSYKEFILNNFDIKLLNIIEYFINPDTSKFTKYNKLDLIYNESIEGHKEYQEQELQRYYSNALNFDKKRINNKMIEEFTKYFVYGNKRFMAVKPASNGYPSAYYEHVKKYNYKVDTINKVILFTDIQ